MTLYGLLKGVIILPLVRLVFREHLVKALAAGTGDEKLPVISAKIRKGMLGVLALLPLPVVLHGDEERVLLAAPLAGDEELLPLKARVTH